MGHCASSRPFDGLPAPVCDQKQPLPLRRPRGRAMPLTGRHWGRTWRRTTIQRQREPTDNKRHPIHITQPYRCHTSHPCPPSLSPLQTEQGGQRPPVSRLFPRGVLFAPFMSVYQDHRCVWPSARGNCFCRRYRLISNWEGRSNSRQMTPNVTGGHFTTCPQTRSI